MGIAYRLPLCGVLTENTINMGLWYACSRPDPAGHLVPWFTSGFK